MASIYLKTGRRPSSDILPIPQPLNPPHFPHFICIIIASTHPACPLSYLIAAHRILSLITPMLLFYHTYEIPYIHTYVLLLFITWRVAFDRSVSASQCFFLRYFICPNKKQNRLHLLFPSVPMKASAEPTALNVSPLQGFKHKGNFLRTRETGGSAPLTRHPHEKSMLQISEYHRNFLTILPNAEQGAD